MQFTLTRNGETATFTPNGQYTEIEITTTQSVGVHVAECVNEWTGACRFTGEIRQQEIKGMGWTEVTTAKARARYAELKKQGWS